MITSFSTATSIFAPYEQVLILNDVQNQRTQLFEKITVLESRMPELATRIKSLQQNLPTLLLKSGSSFVLHEGDSLRRNSTYFINSESKGKLAEGVKGFLEDDNSNVFSKINPFASKDELFGELRFVPTKFTKNFLEERISLARNSALRKSMAGKLSLLRKELSLLDHKIQSLQTKSLGLQDPMKKPFQGNSSDRNSFQKQDSTGKVDSCVKLSVFKTPLREITNI